MTTSYVIDAARDQRTALITMCIGGGQGIATIIERI